MWLLIFQDSRIKLHMYSVFLRHSMRIPPTSTLSPTMCTATWWLTQRTSVSLSGQGSRIWRPHHEAHLKYLCGIKCCLHYTWSKCVCDTAERVEQERQWQPSTLWATSRKSQEVGLKFRWVYHLLDQGFPNWEEPQGVWWKADNLLNRIKCILN